MKAEIAEVFMNPVRQRIIQYLLVHEKGTVKEINFPLFCPKCKENFLIEAQNMEIKNYKQPDAKTQSHGHRCESDSAFLLWRRGKCTHLCGAFDDR